jgi:hypothetical protein
MSKEDDERVRNKREAIDGVTHALANLASEEMPITEYVDALEDIMLDIETAIVAAKAEQGGA